MSSPRLDKYLVDNNLAKSRQHAQALIMAGNVYVNDRKTDKAGKKVPDDAKVEVRSDKALYVSRGGIKLAGALDELKIDVTGLVCLDVGQSTGGFSDCLLQRGAEKVYGVDVGYGQLDLKIRNDPRVTIFERTNFRNFDPDKLPTPVDLVVIDVSFISLTLILPVAKKCLNDGGKILPMIKPQFEVGKGQVGSGGVVRDETARIEAVEKIRTFGINELGLKVGPFCESPITGPKGNHEYFCMMTKK